MSSSQHPLTVLRFPVGPLDNNTYLVADETTSTAIIVDPSFDSRPVWNVVGERGWRISLVVNTHGHVDHVVENVYFVEQSGAPLALHQADEFLLDLLPEQAAWLGVAPPPATSPSVWLEDGQSVTVGDGRLAVTHTPGHSPGSVTLIGPGFALVGDVLFAGSVGRTDLPGGDARQLLDSIRSRLLVLPEETAVWPGHGPPTTIGEERRTNPFLVERG